MSRSPLDPPRFLARGTERAAPEISALMTKAIAETLDKAGLEVGPGPFPPKGKDWRLKGSPERSPPLFEVYAPLRLRPWLGSNGTSWVASREKAGRWTEARANELAGARNWCAEWRLVAVGAEP